MDLPEYAESLWGNDVLEAIDGTYTANLPMLGGQITGLPNRRTALEVCFAVSWANEIGANNAMESDCR